MLFMQNLQGWRSCITIVIASSIGLSSSLAFGMQPLPDAKVNVRVEMKSLSHAEIVVENLESSHAEIDLKPLHHIIQPNPGLLPITPIQPIKPIHHFPPIHIGVPSHQIIRTKFEFEPMKEGVTVVHFQSHVNVGGQIKNGPIFYQVYQATPNGFKEISFEQGFLNKRIQVLNPNQTSKPAELNLGGGFVDKVVLQKTAFKDHVLDAAHVSQIKPVQLGSAIDMANKLRPKMLPEVGGRSRPNGLNVFNGLEAMFSSPFRSADDEAAFNPENSKIEGFALERAEDLDRGLNLMSSFTIRGHMSTKYNDGTFHAAWGWVVTAWQYDKIAGFNFFLPLGWTYVNGDGSWSIPLASFATNTAKVYVQYQTANRFVRVQDPASNPYTWGDWWSLTGAVTDIGYRFADLSANGDLPGIDKLYEGATELWSKFYYNGVNALRDKPIEVTYPNSLASGHCIMNKDSSGNTVPAYAWSCSQWADGKIWIIPAHGDKSVVQHEAAHSINSYYWDGHLSSGSGGAHSLYGCYNGGLALTEGFANFVAYWVQNDRTATSPTASYFNANLESYNGDSCSSGEINELRVAATFWDMYDTHNDGPGGDRYDGWYYTNQSAPLTIYLKNGTKQKMSDYLPIVDAGDPNWYAADKALFRLNKIIP